MAHYRIEYDATSNITKLFDPDGLLVAEYLDAFEAMNDLRTFERREAEIAADDEEPRTYWVRVPPMLIVAASPEEAERIADQRLDAGEHDYEIEEVSNG